MGTPSMAAHERWFSVTPPTTEASKIFVGDEKNPFSPTFGMARIRRNWSTTLLLHPHPMLSWDERLGTKSTNGLAVATRVCSLAAREEHTSPVVLLHGMV